MKYHVNIIKQSLIKQSLNHPQNHITQGVEMMSYRLKIVEKADLHRKKVLNKYCKIKI